MNDRGQTSSLHSMHHTSPSHVVFAQSAEAARVELLQSQPAMERKVAAQRVEPVYASQQKAQAPQAAQPPILGLP